MTDTPETQSLRSMPIDWPDLVEAVVIARALLELRRNHVHRAFSIAVLRDSDIHRHLDAPLHSLRARVAQRTERWELAAPRAVRRHAKAHPLPLGCVLDEEDAALVANEGPGGVKPEHAVKAPSQFAATHCLHAAVSPAIHLVQHFDEVQPTRSPKHEAHPSLYPPPSRCNSSRMKRAPGSSCR
eukprot:CAMPEP_0113268632 /NCGR_PEP_ID=MMETSP0008_2-20120614/21280_1 /TAXON_ID=97485 /ORGANISM="Prymnesium parvum" /LENGTH=183 /DNA_ID=CAMNT_0000117813 /DNA_START=549 /DNA_END=1097 /DNA_ORIENTATION=+ /assembly_acc=CAM_ASM_000153